MDIISSVHHVSTMSVHTPMASRLACSRSMAGMVPADLCAAMLSAKAPGTMMSSLFNGIAFVLVDHDEVDSRLCRGGGIGMNCEGAGSGHNKNGFHGRVVGGDGGDDHAGRCHAAVCDDE